MAIIHPTPKTSGRVTAQRISAAVVQQLFPPRVWAVCPNVSWGLLNYEADILAIGKTGCIHEIEVKISKADLLKDARKWKWRSTYAPATDQVDAYWLAVPPQLEELAVVRAREIGGGVIVVDFQADSTGWVRKVLVPQRKRRVQTDRERRGERDIRNKVWRLAALQYWDQVFRVLHAPEAV